MEETAVQDLVAREVRKAMNSLARRYLPVLAFVVALLLLVVAVPDSRPATLTPDASSAPGTGLPGTGPSGTGPGGAGAPAAPGSGPTTVAGGPGVGTGQPGVGGSQPGSPGSVTTGGGTQPGSTGNTSTYGVAINGTHCGPGVRQFTFSPYSPLCTPKFSGNNGGATAHGVTPTTITLELRKTSDYDATSQAIGASTFDTALHDIEQLVAFYNTQYELYGRKVIVKTFNGQGSYVGEVGGQDQAGAGTDAQSAYDLGAFVDGGPPAPGVYANALTAKKIISIGLPQKLVDARANYPYQYSSLTAMQDYIGIGMGDLVCQRMAGLAADHAGDANLKGKKRTFAAIFSQQSGTSGGYNTLIDEAKKKCGVDIEKHTYQPSPTTEASQAVQLANQLKSEQITSVLLFSDVIFSPIMTNGAAQQGYHPEWLFYGANSTHAARQMNADSLKNMIFAHPWQAQNVPLAQENCSQMYRLASPSAPTPQSGTTIDLLCPQLLELFGALQAAGPNLSPATFGQGWFHQPASAGAGQYGSWNFTGGFFSPDASFNLEYWRADQTSAFDGGSGSYAACREPSYFGYLNATMGSGQLHCL